MSGRSSLAAAALSLAVVAASGCAHALPADAPSRWETMAPTSAVTPAEKLKARQERLERRRARRRIARVKGSTPPKFAELLAITTLLGTRYRKEGMYAGYGSREVLNPICKAELPQDMRRKTVWSIVANLDAGVNAALCEHLWKGQLILLFESRWNYVGAHTPVDAKRIEFQALCELLKIDAAEITRQVKEELPEPKSWAKLREQVAAEKKANRKPKKKSGEEAAAGG